MTTFPELVKQFAESEALRGMEPWLPRNDVWLPGWQDFDVEYRKTKINACLDKLPLAYQSAYGKELLKNMGVLKTRLREEYDRDRAAGYDESFLATKAADWVCVMVDAVLNWAGETIEYSHGNYRGPYELQFGHGKTNFDCKELEQFAVVAGDFYKKFTDAYDQARKFRAGLNGEVEPLPRLDDTLPPLVTFTPTRVWGPHTINPGKMKELIGAPVGVVSLPGVFAKLPLLWAPLAHEVFGHDVSHALGRRSWGAAMIPDLVEELQEKVANNIANKWAPTWRTWTEELAADVAGLLCMGPYFAISLAGLLSATACSDPFGPVWTPGRVGTTLVVRGGHAYDEHPPDLLRLYALHGAAKALLRSQGSKRLSCSVKALKSVVDEAHTPSCMIDVYDFDSQSMLMRYDCGDLIDDAQKIGELIVTTPLKSLGNRRTIDFGSWNNADEDKAREIAEVAKDVSQVTQLPNAVDASHLLAGATMAVYANPNQDAFSKINKFLNAALSERAKTITSLRRLP